MKKSNIIICILLLLFIISNFNSLNKLKVLVEEFIILCKANENYVSKAYNMDIISKEVIFHDIMFYGKDNETNEYAYVFFVKRGIYKVYENEGISKEEALQVFKKYGKDVALEDLSILVWSAFRKGENITEYLYWINESDYRYRVRFIDGVFYNFEWDR